MKIIITENQLKSLIENIVHDYCYKNNNIINEQQNNPDKELEKFYKESDMKIWFLENVVNKVKEITKPEYPDGIFYINKNTGKLYMIYNQKNKVLWVDYYKIWKHFWFNYLSSHMEIQKLIKFLMLEFYGLENVRPYETDDIEKRWIG